MTTFRWPNCNLHRQGESPVQPPGFDGLCPLPYLPENNDLPVQTPPSGFDALRPLAVSW